jgi:zinc transporter ZupT
MGFLQILAGSGALAVFAIGVAMIRLNEFLAAYYLFIVSGVIATLAGLWYGFTSPDSIAMRWGSGFVAGIFVFVLLPIALRWLKRIQEKDGDTSRGTLSGS